MDGYQETRTRWQTCIKCRPTANAFFSYFRFTNSHSVKIISSLPFLDSRCSSLYHFPNVYLSFLLFLLHQVISLFHSIYHILSYTHLNVCSSDIYPLFLTQENHCFSDLCLTAWYFYFTRSWTWSLFLIRKHVPLVIPCDFILMVLLLFIIFIHYPLRTWFYSSVCFYSSVLLLTLSLCLIFFSVGLFLFYVPSRCTFSASTPPCFKRFLKILCKGLLPKDHLGLSFFFSVVSVSL